MAMSLTKFQLCLNHESPGIVKTGLIEFSNQVLKDHDLVGKFGCCGRAYSNITKELVTQTVSSTGPVKGILQSYIQSSPRLDELFVLWQLSGRDDDDSLCIAHTRCMTILLFCTGSIPHLQKLIATKLMNEYVSSVMIQLSNGSMELRKITIGLLLCILRIRNEEMTHRVLDLVLNDPTLFKVSVESLSSSSSPILDEKDSPSVEHYDASTDMRFLLLLFFFTALSSASEITMNLMITENSPFLQLLENVLVDQTSVSHIKLAIEGLILISSHNKTLQMNLFQVQIMNKISVAKWLELYSHDNPHVRDLISCFIEAVTSDVTNLFVSREKLLVKADNTNSNSRKVKPLFAIAKDVSVSLLDLINPSIYKEHEKVKII